MYELSGRGNAALGATNQCATKERSQDHGTTCMLCQRYTTLRCVLVLTTERPFNPLSSQPEDTLWRFFSGHSLAFFRVGAATTLHPSQPRTRSPSRLKYLPFNRLRSGFGVDRGSAPHSWLETEVYHHKPWLLLFEVGILESQDRAWETPMHSVCHQPAPHCLQGISASDVMVLLLVHT